MKKYFCYIGALLFAGTLLWANSLENSSPFELGQLKEEVIKWKKKLDSSQKRCDELERENLRLKKRFENLEDDIASVEKALNLTVRDSEEPDYRLQNICSHVENYYVSTSTKKLKPLSEEDWELINFSLEEREETRERILAYEKFVKKYSGKKIIILEN